jgi:predicted nucleic acid-binding protein
MSQDRVFLDANVLFSVSYGSPGLALLWERARAGECRLLASKFVMEEARRNLSTSIQLAELDRREAEMEVVAEADPGIPCPIDLAEKDRPVLMAAIFSRAKYLLTGDRQHFGRYFGQTVRGVTICTPRDYMLSVSGARAK